MPPTRFNRSHAASGGLLLATILLAWLCYLPGLDADFHFDDRSNLSGLGQVEDTRSALEFVTSGIAGPLGRPVALASFLVNRGAWPDNPSAFLQTNLLIHLINGLLVAWLAWLLCRFRGEPSVCARLAAVLAAATWMLLPILTSTSLLVVQRMTSLSATFVLLGLVCYLLCRRGIEQHPGRALAGMSVSLAAFTLLAVLTKENGALLPVFALVMEATILPTPCALSKYRWRTWRALFLWLPMVAIIGMLISMVPYSEATASMRGFGGWERLLTQASVLWEYLFHAFIPADTSQLGPFQDTYQPARSILDPLTLLAVTGWIAVAGAAWLWRHSVPVFSFAVFWFLAGHLIESTVVPLDLYFEHRNYLPLVGPVFAISWAVVNVPYRYRKLAAAGTVAYIGLLAVTLWLVAAQWGHPFREAQEQYTANPTSSRAVGYFSAHLLGMGLVKPATIVLDRAIERGVAPERLRVTKLYLRCRHGRNTVAGNELPVLLDTMGSAGFDRNLAHALYVLTRTRLGSDCTALDLADARALLDGLEANPAYGQSDEAQYWLHRSRSLLAHNDGHTGQRLRHMEAAMARRFDAVVLGRWIELQVEMGKVEVACKRLRSMASDRPLSPVDYLHRTLVLEDMVRKLERLAPGTGCRLD